MDDFDKKINIENIEEYVNKNLKAYREKQFKKLQKTIDRDYQDLQDTVFKCYNTDSDSCWYYHFVLYGLHRHGKKGLETVAKYAHPDAILKFKNETGFRCLLVKARSSLKFQDYDVYFVITSSNDSDFIKEFKKYTSTKFVKILKEYV